MILDMQHRHSPVWGVIKEQIASKLVILQKELEKPYDLDKTNRIRGGILILRDILNADEEIPVQELPIEQMF